MGSWVFTVIKYLPNMLSKSLCHSQILKCQKSSKKRHKNITSDGFSHIALNVKNLESLHKKLLAIGLEFIGDPKLNPDKTAMVAFCRDFEGNLLELVQTSF